MPAPIPGGSGGGITGGPLTAGRVAYANGAQSITGSAGFTFTDSANVRLATLAGGSSQSTNALLDVTNSAGSSHWLTVLGDGKVGIGMASPTAALEIGTGGNIKLANGNAVIWGAGGGTDFQIGNGTTHQLQWYINSVSRMLMTSTSTGIGTSNTTPTGTLSVLDATASTGATATWIGHDGSGTYSGVHLSALTTTLKVVAGLTQGATNLQEWQGPSGTVLASMSPTQLKIGTGVDAPALTSLLYVTDAGPTHITVRDSTNDIDVFIGANGAGLLGTRTNHDVNFQANGTNQMRLTPGGLLNLTSGGVYGFGATTSLSAPDTSLSRIGAGIIGGGTGSAGSVAGQFRATSLTSVALTVATLPAAPVAGQRCFVTDANATTFLSTVAAGGANAVPVVYDGAAWVIA